MRALRILPIIVLLLALGVTHPAAATTSVDVVASGLDSPRHLAFGSRGDLFVAEAGRGGSPTGLDDAFGSRVAGT